jgi:hypothetical protein
MFFSAPGSRALPEEAQLMQACLGKRELYVDNLPLPC